jgi:formamidopyrimidine-DNA glycosylase
MTSIRRAGKYLLVGLDDDDILVIHLGMSGQLLRAKGPKDPLDKHTHVIITFTQGGQLRFVDPRTFGEMFVTAIGELETVPELSHLGFDPLEEVMSWARFGQLLADRHTPLKTLLMDQKFVAGIGNIYSDEILFAAGLRYDRGSDSLSAQEIRRLYRAMVETLSEAVKYRGSSLADEQYRDLFGEVGDYQGQHQVYDREGQPCRRCRNVIVRVKTGGRSTFFCEHCQV